MRSGASKTSAEVGNVPKGTTVEVLEAATLPTGDVRGRINAPLRGWISLGERFAQKLELARAHACAHACAHTLACGRHEMIGVCRTEKLVLPFCGAVPDGYTENLF